MDKPIQDEVTSTLDGRLEELIQAYNKGEMKLENLKGLSEDQLHDLINRVIMGNTTVKACAYSSWRRYI